MSAGAESPVGTIDEALRNAAFLLLKTPQAALEQSEEIISASPGHVGALIMSARAHRASGALDLAERAVDQVLASKPSHSGALRELALIRVMQHRSGDAVALIGQAVRANRNDAGAWSVLADIRRSTGDKKGAEAATNEAMAVAVRDPECLAPAKALSEERFPDAERLLRLRLSDFPAEVTTIRMMAELATRLGRLNDAEKLLRRALEIAPQFRGARELLARNYQRSNRPVEALTEVNAMLAIEPDDPSLQMLKANLLVRTGDQEGARHVYEKVVAKYPRQAKVWMSLGHVLKTLGHQTDGIAAYRRAIEEQSTLGEAWWSLANLKTFRFSAEDVAAMKAALLQSVDDEDRLHLHFALGKASEDLHTYEAACSHWAAGNALRRKALPYDASENHERVARSKQFFVEPALNFKRGHPAGDPIFIVGMPRAGSTLIEQILASHSQIEGTMELPDMMEISGRLAANSQHEGKSTYPDVLATMTDDEIRSLGAEYLDRTRVHRKTDRPYFIDKMPNNWAHVGLIRTILPNARIIDARRHPAACCFSMWKQHFARGQAFSYDLKDLARYYADYVDLMNHFDQVMPRTIHRVFYERMVSDSAREVRNLLNYLGLPFEDSCLAFWNNDRAVRTASSEQVRQPIFSNAVDHWQNFEVWLKPLLVDLDATIKSYPTK